MTADLRREVHNDPACTDHPHCVCGRVMTCEHPGFLVCVPCRTEVPCDGVQPDEGAL